MAKNKPKTLATFESLDKLVEFFDSADMGKYWDSLPEAHFEVNLKRKRHLIKVDEELVDKLTEIAKLKKVSAETLVNSWLKEKILSADL